MVSEPQAYGQRNETLAASFLRRKGYQIIATNYRTRAGEIDIIARDRQQLVFVEVKARRTRHFGPSKAAVTPAKQRKLSRTALWYLKETRQMAVSARFDVVAIDNAANRLHQPKIELIRNAFDLVSA